MSTLEAAFGQLPEPILNKLGSMIRRVRRLLFLRGLFATLAVALACLLTIMIIDASVTLFSSASRWALSLVGLAITAVAAWRFMIRPLSRKFTLTHMARILEIRHPELQERISTAVELLSSDDPDSIKGSEELIAAVVDSAVVDVESVDPNTEFNPARTRKFRNVAIAFAAILLLSLVIWPKQSWTLLTRALAPFLDIGNAYADSLVVDPGDIRIAQGESVSIEVSVKHKRLRRAEIRRLMPDGTESVERMTLVGEDSDGTKRFSTTFPSVEVGFDYRIRAGAALTRYYDVDAVAPPMVDQLTIGYDYPDYTGLESTSAISETGEIRAVAHTRVTIEANVNKPVQTSKLLVNGTKDLGVPEVDGNLLRWEFELKPKMKGNWQLDLTDLDGFANPTNTYPLEGLPDKAPTVQLTQPVLREMKLRPTERLQLHANVIEDFGVQDVTLLVTPQGASQPIEIPQPAATSAQRLNTYHAAALLDLASLPLKPGQKRVVVQMRVRDNRPSDYAGPGVGLSEMIYIEIDRSAKSLADQAIEAQKKEVQEGLKEAKEELEKARDDIRKVEEELKKEEEVSSEAREKLEEFSEHTEKARDELDKVAAALDEGVFEEQAEKAAEIADETIAEAREKADLVPVLDEKEEQLQEAKEAREKIEEAIQQVEELSKEMEKSEDDYEMISELNELSNKQQELAMNAEEMAEQAKANEQAQNPQSEEGQQPSEMTPEEKQKLAEFQAQQERLQQELGEMLKENAAALSEVLEEKKADAQEMAQKAAELAEQQNEVREMTQEAVQADSEQEEALREQLLAFLEKEQSELAADAAEQAAQAQEEANQAQAEQNSENPSGEESSSEPSASEQANTDPASSEPQESEGANEESSESSPESSESQASAESESQPESGETPEGSETAQSDPSSSEPSSESSSESESESSPEQALAEQLAEAAQEAAEAAEALGEENLDAASEAANEASESLAEAASQSEAAESSESGESPAESSESESSESGSPEMAEAGDPASAESPTGSEPGSEESSSSEESASQSSGSESGSPESGAPESGSPESSPSEMAEESGSDTTPAELAERQEALAEQIDAVKNGDLQEALAQIEAQLAEEASELQAEASALEESLENLSQNSAESGANRAEEALSRGAQKASEAASQLSQAQEQQSQAESQSQVAPGEMSQGAQQAMSQSLGEQESSADYLEQAAEALAATSEAIGQTQEGLEPSDMDERIADSSDLADGFEEMGEAAQSQSAQEAAQQSQQAAEAMQKLAQAAMEKLGMPGTPSPDSPPGPPMPPQEMTGDPTSESLNESGMKAADANGSGIPPELEELGISAEDWAKFRGTLVGGSATAIETDLPAEYRELVGRYFQVIAKEAAKKKK